MPWDTDEPEAPGVYRESGENVGLRGSGEPSKSLGSCILDPVLFPHMRSYIMF